MVSNNCTSDSFVLRSLTVCTLELRAEVSKKTAVNWASFCREVIYDAFILNKQKLGDPGVEVEIDEFKFGRSSVLLRFSPYMIVLLRIRLRRYKIVIWSHVIRQNMVVYREIRTMHDHLRVYTDSVSVDLGYYKNITLEQTIAVLFGRFVNCQRNRAPEHIYELVFTSSFSSKIPLLHELFLRDRNDKIK